MVAPGLISTVTGLEQRAPIKLVAGAVGAVLGEGLGCWAARLGLSGYRCSNLVCDATVALWGRRTLTHAPSSRGGGA